MMVLLLRAFLLFASEFFGAVKGASYGVMRSDLQCYNCTWNRKVNSTIWERVPAPSEFCRLHICAAVDGVCVKDVAKKDGVVLSIRRFCATSNEAQGCFARDEMDGVKRTMCLCSDWHYCNSTNPLRFTSYLLMCTGAMLYFANLMFQH